MEARSYCSIPSVHMLLYDLALFYLSLFTCPEHYHDNQDSEWRMTQLFINLTFPTGIGYT
jgi:hypothetical protein